MIAPEKRRVVVPVENPGGHGPAFDINGVELLAFLFPAGGKHINGKSDPGTWKNAAFDLGVNQVDGVGFVTTAIEIVLHIAVGRGKIPVQMGESAVEDKPAAIAQIAALAVKKFVAVTEVERMQVNVFLTISRARGSPVR